MATTASTKDAEYQDAVAQLWAARGNRDTKAEAHWQSVIDQLKDNKGGELAQQMSKGRK